MSEVVPTILTVVAFVVVAAGVEATDFVVVVPGAVSDTREPGRL